MKRSGWIYFLLFAVVGSVIFWLMMSYIGNEVQSAAEQGSFNARSGDTWSFMATGPANMKVYSEYGEATITCDHGSVMSHQFMHDQYLGETEVYSGNCGLTGSASTIQISGNNVQVTPPNSVRSVYKQMILLVILVWILSIFFISLTLYLKD